MKTILFAMLLAAGIGLAGTSTSVSAAPANGIAIGQTVDLGSAVVKAQWHSRWRSRRGWRGRRCFWRHYRFSRSVRRCYR